MWHHVALVGGLQTTSNFGKEVQPIHGVFHRRVFRQPLHGFTEQLFRT